MLIYWMIFVLNQINQPGRDSSGAAIALFTANLHTPLTVTHQTTLQGVVYQLDIALQNADTQRSGLVFIYDMSSSKYSHFDYDLSQKILTLLKVSVIFSLWLVKMCPAFDYAKACIDLGLIFILISTRSLAVSCIVAKQSTLSKRRITNNFCANSSANFKYRALAYVNRMIHATSIWKRLFGVRV